MALLTAAAAVLLQVTPADTVRIGRPRPAPAVPPAASAPVPAQPGDSIFDTPATRALVERVIRAGSDVPADLRDYRADMQSAVYLSLRPDTAPGGELPVTVDEFAGAVRWERGGTLHQEVTGHRVRMLAPTPYTIGSMLESPWVIPHLYGNTIDVFQLAPGNSTAGRGARVSRAVHPFSYRGMDFYRYTSGSPVRVATQAGTTTLVPITVRRRVEPERSTTQLVAGTFWVDADRAAVARARFGFLEPGGGFRLTETGVYFELESGLVSGRYWLPVRQRREIQVTTPLFGGAAAVRLVTLLRGFEFNTGWTPPEPGRSRIVRVAQEGDPFRGWSAGIGEEEGEFDISDFADLRDVVRPDEAEGPPVRVALRWERGDHLFRYNRVEGAFVGVGVKAEPRDPARRTWDAYATGGWAFGEGTARGEASLRWHPNAQPAPGEARWTTAVTGYRRLRDPQAFRPSLQWELGLAINAALAGFDVRDYYDAAGAEASVTRVRGPWRASLGGRWERQDSVSRNVDGGLFGGAADLPPIAPAEPGTHGALEAELRFDRGSGAFGIGRSLVASVRAEQGLADFRFTRVTGLVSARRDGRYVTLVARGDGGILAGDGPPQFLYRFGGREGLRGYDLREFGGSRAVLGRGRVLLHLPPYSSQPLFRVGFFAFPPLRPALVVSGDAGWSDVDDDHREALARTGSVVTDGTRASYGAGISLFDDALSAEFVRPAGGGEGRWYLGFVQWF
jgi:hypothetical protein